MTISIVTYCLRRIVFGAMFLLGGSLSSVMSAVLAEESFQYEEGSLVGMNALNKGFSGGWTKNISGTSAVRAGSLSFPGVPEIGNAALITNSTATRALNTINITTSGTTTWIGFLFSFEASVSPPGDGFLTVRPDTGSSPASRFGAFTDSGGKMFFGIGSNIDSFTSPVAFSNFAAVSGETYFLLASITWDVSVGGKEIIKLYVNPDLSTSLPTIPDATRSDLNVARTVSGELNRLTTMNLTSGLPGSSWVFDEIRIVSDLRDISPSLVPEPSTLICTLFGSLLVVFRRRTRSIT